MMKRSIESRAGKKKIPVPASSNALPRGSVTKIMVEPEKSKREVKIPKRGVVF